MTGVSQVLFPGKADGSRIERDGKVVGSRLIGQDFSKRVRTRRRGPTRPRPTAYFQSRPSATGYSADVTYFNNLGPEQRGALRDFFEDRLAAYLDCERPYNPGLTAADVPVDAVTTSASGVDPHISQANARIQAHRVAAVRGIPLERVERADRREHRRARARLPRRARRERARAEHRTRTATRTAGHERPSQSLRC